MISKEIEEKIQHRLNEAEKEHGVRVLYAVESGSRAWGFASPNSDYDVRFIYAHPKDWYVAVNLEEKRDVIEYPIVDEIDISGWDVRKALRLFKKSNPSFVEWLQSPIVYRDDNLFAKSARSILDSDYSYAKGIYHYRSMAKTNYRGYLRKEMVPLKKYFYVLRPLLSILWLEKKQTPAPIEFHRLREMVKNNQALDEAITDLLQQKKKALEKEIAPAIPAINKFIVNELDRLEGFGEPTENKIEGYDSLNQLFHQVLSESRC
ncbi:nucleotidyltransferase domain-containing protein [Aliikangiella coralliicola]|uniref:Nucleotidyltransferase domain-containing protein n=1 Tax=Aliikangiella coralliicola TaxID=2592383 RepID=A0A545UIQ5_9GAMM|nr:nucleotidyltransferase domain-containing protein [Aliikangiella coralliicola]TQV89313.1 nucleotidyltransferase domain-containing protein [Aliikangiella coralliicola]